MLEIIAESNYSFLPPKKGNIKMLNGKLYYCAEVKVEYFIAYVALWRPVLKDHLSEVLKIDIKRK